MSLRDDLAKIIWDTSRADESTISATGANIVADAIIARFGGVKSHKDYGTWLPPHDDFGGLFLIDYAGLNLTRDPAVWTWESLHISTERTREPKE